MLDLSQYIEHTALKATVTRAQIEMLCAEAVTHKLRAVCVPPGYVTLAERCIRGSSVRLATVVGFPLGSNKSSIKAREASEAVADGAHEIDMVGAIGLALGGAWDAVQADVDTVRRAVPSATLKVILETGCFGEQAVQRFADIAIRAGADFVKTSTGFGPRGASVEDVRLLCGIAAGRAQIKASGGIRNKAMARALIAAGATRIGTSEGVALVS
jgi:deoxyribose-phosphate aldolase